MPLDDAQIDQMSAPAWDLARRALDAGDLDGARGHLDDAVERWRGLQDYSINWITSLLSFVADELGEDAVERALRRTGDEFVRPRRGDPGAWDALPAEVRARAVARSMVANFATVEVDEDDEAITLRFRCGTGGRLLDEGRYETEGGSYRVLRDAAPRTFGRTALPVYCAHCAINNEIQPMEWGGAPTTVESPPRAPGDVCEHRIARDPAAAAAEVRVRLGLGDSGG